MVREIPSREPSIVVSKHRFDRSNRIDGAVSAGDLPHAVQNTADVEIGGELEAACGRQRHLHSPGNLVIPSTLNPVPADPEASDLRCLRYLRRRSQKRGDIAVPYAR